MHLNWLAYAGPLHGIDVGRHIGRQVFAPRVAAQAQVAINALAGSGGGTTITGDVDHAVCHGRLTPTTTVPVTTSDVTAAGTIYFAPFHGNFIGLYDGSAWALHSFSELSLGLSGISSGGGNYDLFVYDNAGTPTLEIGAHWTDDVTRAEALAFQDGVLLKSGALTRRYVGTIRASGANVTEDSEAKRYVWNLYNQVPRTMRVQETTNSWNYSTATLRQANGAATNQLDYVVGQGDVLLEAHVKIHCGGDQNNNVRVGVGVDSTTVDSSQLWGSPVVAAGAAFPIVCEYRGYPGLGRHKLVWLEKGLGVGTQTWYGDNGGDLTSGIFGTMMG